MNITVSIPCKPYLVKFVEYIECLEPGQHLEVNNSGVLGRIIRLLATNKDKLKDESTKSYFGDDKEFTGSLTFRITARMQARNCFFFHRDTTYDINYLLYLQFHEFLFEKIRDARRKDEKAQIKAIIEEWRDVLKFSEDDIDYDSIKRSNHRFRVKKHNKSSTEQSPASQAS